MPTVKEAFEAAEKTLSKTEAFVAYNTCFPLGMWTFKSLPEAQACHGSDGGANIVVSSCKRAWVLAAYPDCMAQWFQSDFNAIINNPRDNPVLA